MKCMNVNKKHSEILGPGERRHAGECGNETLHWMNLEMNERNQVLDWLCVSDEASLTPSHH